MIICTGSPGSGKSTFTKRFLKDYVRINNDEYKTKEKCAKMAAQFLKEGKSVVIDNTNPKRELRSLYLKIAKDLKVPARSVYFDTPKEVCIHNNEQRGTNPHHDHASKMVPMIALHMFFKNVQTPLLSEGFESIIKVNFLADLFDNKQDEEHYNM